MRRLAEGLTGIATVAADVLDPEYLPSIEAAKGLAGFEIKAPEQILADMRFAYAVYRDASSPVVPNSVSHNSPEVVLVYFGSTLDSIERRHSFLFYQNPAPANTLDELVMGGGEWVSVNGLPAIYSQSCWEDIANGGNTTCLANLSWLDTSGIRFDITAYLPGAIDREVLIAIAESMR
ncbi:MAG: hypothetical protein JXB07_08835 [Anaerolineae bacterium]|nr:hypothetical protein [Anaerolineae bacterium]